MNHQAGFEEVIYPLEYTDEKAIPELKVKLLETQPAQAYQPGTVTAYSNCGTGLAAYLIEEQTGMPIYQYVQGNIFKPIGMKHTAIKADWSDNPWVKSQREKMKTYLLMEGISESYGPQISYISLYPAGSATGTISDFLTFCQKFTNAETPLFEKPETLEQMLSATSHYSNGLARNYHGLWSLDYGAKLMGHGGNTQGFSSAFWFDTISNTGFAVMTNEVGETAYNYGLAELLYGPAQSERGENL